MEVPTTPHEPIIDKRTLRKPVSRATQNRRMALFAVLVALLLMCVPLLPLNNGKDEFTLDTYDYSTARTKDFNQLIQANGTTTAGYEVTIRANVPGIVGEVAVKPGDRVTEGQVLATLYSAELDRALVSAKREEAEAKRALERARINGLLSTDTNEINLGNLREALVHGEVAYKRVKTLYEEGTLTITEFETARERYEQGKAALDAAKAKARAEVILNRQAEKDAGTRLALAGEDLAAAEKALRQTRILSPITGKVLDLIALMGQPIQSGEAVAVVGDTSRTAVIAQVDATRINQVGKGQRVKVETPYGAAPGLVTGIAPQAKQGTSQNNEGSTVEVRIELDRAASGALVPGTPVSVSIVVGRMQNVVCLPRGPFVSSSDGIYIFVISANDPTKAIRREVSFGLIDGGNIGITKGLEPGESVIVSSYEEFRSYKEVILSRDGGRRI